MSGLCTVTIHPLLILCSFQSLLFSFEFDLFTARPIADKVSKTLRQFDTDRAMFPNGFALPARVLRCFEKMYCKRNSQFMERILKDYKGMYLVCIYI